MISAIIIDDEPNNITNIKLLVQKYCPDVDIIATAFNAKEARKIILQVKPDLVFWIFKCPAKMVLNY